MSNPLFRSLKPAHRAALDMMFAKPAEASPAKPKLQVGTDAHMADVKARCERRFAVIDELDPAIRALIHEYSWASVKVFLDLGVAAPKQIAHMIRTVRDGRA